MTAKIIGFLVNRSNMMKWLFFCVLAGAVGYDFFAERHHPHFWGDHIIGFWAGFGLFGCLTMIVICKGISHAWLMKGEDYYDN